MDTFFTPFELYRVAGAATRFSAYTHGSDFAVEIFRSFNRGKSDEPLDRLSPARWPPSSSPT
jgi:hypothetical protein